jgi:hypothetical protein
MPEGAAGANVGRDPEARREQVDPAVGPHRQAAVDPLRDARTRDLQFFGQYTLAEDSFVCSYP